MQEGIFLSSAAGGTAGSRGGAAARVLSCCQAPWGLCSAWSGRTGSPLNSTEQLHPWPLGPESVRCGCVWKDSCRGETGGWQTRKYLVLATRAEDKS